MDGYMVIWMVIWLYGYMDGYMELNTMNKEGKEDSTSGQPKFVCLLFGQYLTFFVSVLPYLLGH